MNFRHEDIPVVSEDERKQKKMSHKQICYVFLKFHYWLSVFEIRVYQMTPNAQHGMQPSL